MLLIFPSIEISNKRCVQFVQGEPGAEHLYGADPVQMAVLWRGENAKTLHVVDVDGVAEGTVKNRDIIRQMVEAVDIPIQVGGGLRSYEEVRELFALGVYRIVIGTAAVEQPELVERVVKEYGARKVVIGISSRHRNILIDGGKKETGIAPIQLTKRLKKLGVCRVLYRELEADGVDSERRFDNLRELASATNVRVTAWGGVENYRDLIRLQELEKFGVDSVVIGQPLYQNRFPCQRLWRVNEKELTDFGPTRRR
jgi:phosphoribosylformimino-5-aminoimidazole carboxamide ribotide isomerase